MRSATICEACRRRHRKCITTDNGDKCNACKELNLECNFVSRIRFKHSQAPRRLSQASSFSTITFVKDSSGKDNADCNDNADAKHPAKRRKKHSARSNSSDRRKLTTIAAGVPSVSPLIAGKYNSPQQSPPSTSCDTSTASERSSNTSLVPNVVSIPYLLTTSRPVWEHQVPLTCSAPSHSLRDPSTVPELTQREAFLIQTYIQILAPSVSTSKSSEFGVPSSLTAQSDACDELQHFALVVPQLALQEPMLLNGILALASSYDGLRTNTNSDIESTHYHNLCIKELIQAFSRPPEMWDSTLLTGVVIARLYEEYDNEADSHDHHLSGTSNLLNHGSVARFITQGGLAEAASWVHLRQAIYVSIVCRKPLAANLDNFRCSTAFWHNTNSAYANKMVFALCKALQLFFGDDNGSDDSRSLSRTKSEDWPTLEQEVARWYDERPLPFRAIYYDEGILKEGKSIPDIRLISSVAVVGLQHYWAFKIIFHLRTINNTNTNAGYSAIRQRMKTETDIVLALRILMGLALSNEKTINAFYLPAHMLSLCGYCIRNPAVRSDSLDYLAKATDMVQWKTKSLRQRLKDEWKDLDMSENRSVS